MIGYFMMTSGMENIGIRNYKESLSDFTRYIMENPGKNLTLDLNIPKGYEKEESSMKDMDIMNEYLKNLKNYNKFNFIKESDGVFMSRITYNTSQTLAYADINSLNGALDDISFAIIKSGNSH